MPSPDRFTSDPSAPRRFCCVCGRWRQRNDFAVRQWADKEKTVPKYMASECRVCHRAKARERWENATKKQREHARVACRLHYRIKRRRAGVHEVGPRVTVKKIRGDVPRHEVAEWIRGRLASGEYQNPAEWRAGRFMGISEFSSACGVDQRYIRMILDGYMIKKGRRVPYDWVSYDLVDRMLQNEGTTTLDDLFPLEELDEAA